MAPPGGARAMAALLLFHRCSSVESADRVPVDAWASSGASVRCRIMDTLATMGKRKAARRLVIARTGSEWGERFGARVVIQTLIRNEAGCNSGARSGTVAISPAVDRL